MTKSSVLKAAVIGGSVAGTLDLTQASLLFGWDIPKAIAAGLIGVRAFTGGVGIYLLGVVLHYLIALTFATFYCGVSRRLRFLAEYPLVCGLVYGAAVDEVMNLVVLPLSALHARGPYTLHDRLLGIGMHAVVIGLPIAYSAWWLMRDEHVHDSEKQVV